MQSSVHQTELLPGYVLFVGTAFSITALPILGRILTELDLTRSRVGVIAISSAAINDVVGWIMLAVVTTPALKIWLNLNKRANLEGISQS